jgi:glucosylceramidase
MKKALTSTTCVGLAALFAACSGGEDPPGGGGSGNATSGGSSGSTAAGTTSGGKGGSSGTTGGTNPTGGAGGSNPTGGTAGANPTGGSAGAASGAGGSAGGGAGASSAGTSGASGGVSPAGGSAGAAAGTDAGGQAGSAGMGGTGEPLPELPPLVTSAEGAYWKTDATPTDSTAQPTVTVNATQEAQTWEGFGGSFNELGWKYLTSQAMKDTALRLLFSATEGANFVWGRIPMGASDYAEIRYTLDDPAGTDPTPNGESARPPLNNNFSLTRDQMYLLPYIKAAQLVKPGLKFWASPWTPPIWAKSGFKTNAGCGTGSATKPSYFDGGTMKSDGATLTAYAQYFVKFVDAYAEQGIDVDVVSPQNEPGYDQNYPSALWDASTYTTFIRDHLGPAMMTKGVGVMLGTMSNAGDCDHNDIDIATAVLADSAASAFLTVAGVQWGVLGRVMDNNQRFGSLPIWATEHKCGNYPWNPEGFPAYVMTAPNNHAYAAESWGYLKGAIARGGVTTYSAWNMVLDRVGLGNDTTRHWAQNALLVADNMQVTPTPTYHVFRHLSQYVAPGAKVVGTTGGDALGFKNPDGSIVAVMYNGGSANPNYVVSLGGKTLQFAMPGNGWATVMVKPS